MKAFLAAAALTMSIAPPAPAMSVPAEVQAEPIKQLTTPSGIRISYRISGPAKGHPMLLMSGTGMQLIEWPPELIEGLVKRGFRVIVFDHRDAGGSTHFTDAGMPDWAAIFAALGAGRTPALPYTADAMTQDCVALLDGLGIGQADVLGVSGGATLAQLLALAAPERVRTLTLIAASSGNPALPLPAVPERVIPIPQPQPGWDAKALVERQVAVSRAFAGKGSGFDEAAARKLAERIVARDADPLGFARQGAALLVLGDLRPRQARIAKPTVVLHGDDDPLISPKSGEEVARTIPGARFVLVPGMGHDLPRNQVPAILTAVAQISG